MNFFTSLYCISCYRWPRGDPSYRYRTSQYWRLERFQISTYIEHFEALLPRREGPFKHITKGFLVLADQAEEFEALFLPKEDFTDLKGHVMALISMLWPSTTALTFGCPDGLDVRAADFHQGRIDVGAGMNFWQFLTFVRILRFLTWGKWHARCFIDIPTGYLCHLMDKTGASIAQEDAKDLFREVLEKM